MAYFHIEDAFEQRMNYGMKILPCLVNKTQTDSFIANEIRQQVNGSQQRSIFSVSKSLGIVLFKYNKIGDNPLHIIPIDNPNYLEVTLNPDDCHYLVPYDLQIASSQVNMSVNQENFYLHNYVIDVSNNCALNQYLQTYTHVGKHPYAACEKDQEVLMRHLTPNFTISEEVYIDAVYLIYALNYRYGFLCNPFVYNQLLTCCRYYTKDNYNSYIGFQLILRHLADKMEDEKKSTGPILLQKQQEWRPVCDMYYIALEILDTTLEDGLDLAYDDSYYCLNYRFLDDLWKIFLLWKTKSKIT